MKGEIMKRIILMFNVILVTLGILVFSDMLLSDENVVESPKIENSGTSKEDNSSTETIRAAAVEMKSCIKCGLCAAICPSGAIKIVDHKPVIDPEKCTQCGLCISRCPTKAISYKEYEIEKEITPSEPEDKKNKSE